jgi:phosphatidylserine/phosphatidylglycerophosphate/cardiolipin synthase-like enzyme
MTITLKVFQNGDDVFLAWRSSKFIDECRGFAVELNRNGKSEYVESYAGFEDEIWKRGDKKPSTKWPIQKFSWTHYTARPGDRVSYRVVPMVGPRTNLDPVVGEASAWSKPMRVDAQVSPGFSVYFNRGIVASQWVQQLLGADKSVRARAKRLDEVILDLDKPKERNALAGELRLGLLNLLGDAKKNKRNVFAALFELTDPELVKALADLKSRAYVVLANGTLPKKKKKGAEEDNDVPANSKASKDENVDARAQLKKAGVDVSDRMSAPKFLAHNKLLVVCDAKKVPRLTWTGSTNWTPSGLCTQANNGILIDDKDVADRCVRQIRRLGVAGNDSTPALAKFNSEPARLKVGSANLTLWFTRTLKGVDLEDAKRYIADAAEGAIFLMFQTGATKSLLEAIMNRRTEKDFFVHGVISTPPQEGGKKKGKKKKLTAEEAMANRVAFVHKNERKRYAPDLLIPFARQKATEQWFAEFVKKNGAHAIVHSKIIVLDPQGKKPVVITGSHNMGTTASKTNDENMVIVEGDEALAAAYAVNIMSIYNSYRWRYRVAQGTKWKGSWNNDRWQRSYLTGDNKQEIDFWM